MFIPRVGMRAFLTSLCCLSAGCQTTSTMISAIFPRHGTAVDSEVATVQPEVLLSPGMEVQWQVQAPQNQPGQVNGGKGMVGPDGTMDVGPYGSCQVAGLTLNQATGALEKHLAEFINSPNVRLNLPVQIDPTEIAWRPARADGITPVFPSAPVVAAENVKSFSDTGIQPVSRVLIVR